MSRKLLRNYHAAIPNQTHARHRFFCWHRGRSDRAHFEIWRADCRAGCPLIHRLAGRSRLSPRHRRCRSRNRGQRLGRSFWRLLRREKLTRISGLALFKVLLETADARIPGNLFFILPSEKAKTKTLEFGRNSGYPTTADDCYVAPTYQRSEVRDQRSDFGGQAFLPAEQTDPGKRERLPYTSSLSGAAAPPFPG